MIKKKYLNLLLNKNTEIYFNEINYSKIKEYIDNDTLIITSIRNHDFFLNELKLSIKSSNIYSNFSSNPKLSEINSFAEYVNKFNFKKILAFGGGSAIDFAKISSILISNKKLHLSDVGLDSNLKRNIDLTVVPTTFGTGSEVTPFATYWDDKNDNLKCSLLSYSIVPDKVFIYPNFIRTTPNEVLISTFLDSLNQLFESIWNKNFSNKVFDLSSEAIINLLYISNKNFLDIKGDKHRSELLALSSLYSGIAISNTKTALCHSISYPLTSKFGVPHGLACSFSMLEVLNISIKNDDGRIKKLIEMFKYKFGHDDILNFLKNLLISLDIPKILNGYLSNISNNDIDEIIFLVNKSERSDNYFLDISKSQLKDIINNSLTFCMI